MTNIKNIEDRKNHFINKANKRYNFFFDYSKFIYVNAKTKSIIICPIHGEFQQTPDKHLQGVNPCPSCEKEAKAKRGKIFAKTDSFKEKIINARQKEIQEFLKQAYNKFDDKFEYDFANYSGITGNKIKIKCPIHGWFEKVPRVFIISNFGCSECGKEHARIASTKSYESFVSKAIQVHHGKYKYPESNKKIYKNRKSWIEIECEKHGIFMKQAEKHLAGQGCFKCRIEELVEQGILAGGYNTYLFKNNEKIANKIGHLYYLKINNGQYYKIGITTKLKQRLRHIKNLFEQIELIKSKEGRLEDLYYSEQKILKFFNDSRVYTKQTTELFNEDISKKREFDILFYNFVKDNSDGN